MKVLHVVLEYPQNKTSGGLTRYAVDLVKEQSIQGMSVCTLQPGYFDWWGKTRIRKVEYDKNVEVCKVVNPLPIAIPFGVREPGNYIRNIDKDIYMQFLLKLKPDIIHAHTVMGIQKEFFKAAKKIRIPIIYTTHDYFGLCARTNFIDHSGSLCNGVDINKCIICNKYSGVPYFISKMLQSEVYASLKNTKLLKTIRSYGRRRIAKKENSGNYGNPKKSHLKYQDFEDLYIYYKKILIPSVHFILTALFQEQFFKNTWEK